MRIENNIYTRPVNYRNNYKQSKTNNTPSFEGLGIKSLDFNRPARIMKARKQLDELWLSSGKLGVPVNIVNTCLGKDASANKYSLLRKLADSYNARNYYKEANAKEDPINALYILRDVIKPQEAHYNILERSDMSFKTLHNIFNSATKPKELEFVQIMQHDVLNNSDDSGRLILKILQSKHKDNIIKNIDEYSSYIKLNAQNENCVESLEKLIDYGKFDKKFFDKELSFKNLIKYKRVDSLTDGYKDFVKANMTDANRKFLKIFAADFYPYRKEFTKQDTQDLMSMFKSTTDKNIESRIRILEKFKYDYAQNESTTDTREMRKLFESMDKNSHIKSFVENALNDNIKIESIEKLNEVISAVPPKKAAIFHKNIARIVRFTSPAERKAILQSEIENPFYPAKRMNEKPRRETVYPAAFAKVSKFEKISTLLENKLNIMKYNRMMKGEQEGIEPVIIETDNIFRTVPNDFINVPHISETISAPTVTEPAKLNLLRTLKTLPSARKLKVKADVNEVIKKKLGQKTYESQSRDYGLKATAIRLKLLPEIFDSISATRKAQRAAGKRPNIENKDALMLYEKITGRNRKLVRYMLKQTDAENNKLFNIKDVIALIEKTEKEIAQQKKINPQFRASDAKAKYEEIFQNMVAEHGKLKRSKKAA